MSLFRKCTLYICSRYMSVLLLYHFHDNVNNLVLTSCLPPSSSDFLLWKTSLIGAVDVTVLHIEYQVYRESISDKILIIVFSQKMINDMKWWLIVVKLNNMIFKEVTFDTFLKADFKISWNLGTSYRHTMVRLVSAQIVRWRIIIQAFSIASWENDGWSLRAVLLLSLSSWGAP